MSREQEQKLKVKVFYSNNYEMLEAEINNWLKENPGAVILYVQQSSDAGTDISLGCVVITVWYKIPNRSKTIKKELKKEAEKGGLTYVS